MFAVTSVKNLPYLFDGLRTAFQLTFDVKLYPVLLQYMFAI